MTCKILEKYNQINKNVHISYNIKASFTAAIRPTKFQNKWGDDES